VLIYQRDEIRAVQLLSQLRVESGVRNLGTEIDDAIESPRRRNLMQPGSAQHSRSRH
jgi:hypothetical protein